tara:strand:+ start:240 stop:551 length:312 start_codon:yes stop_codon:yes gene_type:complete
MATSTVIYNQLINLTTVNLSNSYPAEIIIKDGSSTVQDKSYQTGKINTRNYALAKPIQSKRSIKVSQKLPFYISFQNITVATWGPSNPAPIGIAIIAYSNYIL